MISLGLYAPSIFTCINSHPHQYSKLCVKSEWTPPLGDFIYTIGIIQTYDYNLLLGTLNLISANPELLTGTADTVTTPTCRKDTGQAKKLRKWSRGHQFVVLMKCITCTEKLR